MLGWIATYGVIAWALSAIASAHVRDFHQLESDRRRARFHLSVIFFGWTGLPFLWYVGDALFQAMFGELNTLWKEAELPAPKLPIRQKSIAAGGQLTLTRPSDAGGLSRVD